MHLNKTDGNEKRQLYRVFYYDCPPIDKNVYHPLHGNVSFGKTRQRVWTEKFFNALKEKRKFALRMGRISNNNIEYQLKPGVTKELIGGRKKIEDLEDKDFKVAFKQKGVDMKLGIDVSSLAYEGIVDQIILIAGDSDFVPAAKVARRKGIDFILDPMGNSISPDLKEHIDGLEQFVPDDPLKKQRNNDHQESES